MRQDCPCGSGCAYFVCCGRFVEGDALPATAEQLMRSRYTAYALSHGDYLLATWHPSTRPLRLDFDPTQRWLGLKIVRCEAGSAGDSEGAVAFVARSKRGGRAQRLEEDSRFVRENGRWYYLYGRLGDDAYPGAT